MSDKQDKPQGPDRPAMKGLAAFCRPAVPIYDRPARTKQTEQGTVSAIADEGLYGMSCRILEERKDGWVRILTLYGYTGYVRCEELRTLTAKEAENGRPAVIDCRLADIMNIPSVKGVCLISLGGGSVVKTLPGQCETPGWMRVCLLDGQQGYLMTQFLEEKRFSEDCLSQDEETVTRRIDRASQERLTSPGGCPGFLLQRVLDRWYNGSEEAFRENLTSEAKKYLGTQYRWGGRSFDGIDCSGLVSEAYMRSGILIYRDALIVSGYPVKRLYSVSAGRINDSDSDQMSASLKKGDLLYFPGHTAMYIGNGRYIHSTARIGSGKVVINSMRKEDEDYRPDLRETLYAVGGVR